ncbi:Transcription factor bHLH112 [Apostasia shenzhenica]|uniref:Transcription factor bHLH112 n=1 Tax=Apostasia shenzhenica TaxID=1088818 RepID=A0A2H9ZSV5_9ASPA|nr:Transcription factor bHLH112 [Apostasia shenzhenica]
MLVMSACSKRSSSHVMLIQEDPIPRPLFRQELGGSTTMMPSTDMSQPFLLASNSISSSSSSPSSSSYGFSFSMIQNSFYGEQEMPNYQSQMVSDHQPPWSYRPPPHEQLFNQKQQSTINQLQFKNNAPFWNASAATMGETSHGSYSSFSSELPVTSGGPVEEIKKTSGEVSLKKPRMETAQPSLPAFKVRKEKLGDRITALQQLVSPFGKTDTASVLHEAIEYIKFLHDQVNALSTPYLKNGHPMQKQQNSEKSNYQDLRSRGLCLVPIASTYPVSSESTSHELWTPAFGRVYR